MAVMCAGMDDRGNADNLSSLSPARGNTFGVTAKDIRGVCGKSVDAGRGGTLVVGSDVNASIDKRDSTDGTSTANVTQNHTTPLNNSKCLMIAGPNASVGVANACLSQAVKQQHKKRCAEGPETADKSAHHRAEIAVN
jgi:hypothetical protein